MQLPFCKQDETTHFAPCLDSCIISGIGYGLSSFSNNKYHMYPEAFPLRDARLNVMGGDVFDLALVEQAVAGQDGVLSTLDVPFSRKPITIHSQGLAHIVQAMNHPGVRRVVCASSSATGTNHDTGNGSISFS